MFLSQYLSVASVLPGAQLMISMGVRIAALRIAIRKYNIVLQFWGHSAGHRRGINPIIQSIIINQSSISHQSIMNQSSINQSSINQSIKMIGPAPRARARAQGPKAQGPGAPFRALGQGPGAPYRALGPCALGPWVRALGLGPIILFD